MFFPLLFLPSPKIGSGLLSLSLSSLQIGLIGDGFSLSLALFSISSELLTLQENRSTATKPFCHTKVSISSLDVPGDEMVH